ncbi:MAG TPA: hypothetical protein VM186_12655 [Planctomycetota bacterium]|nr:hypothetical protein [Planctomycetota bacterium]
MKAGASQVCITPTMDVDLTGFWAREQPSLGVHDDLYARGLYLDEAGRGEPADAASARVPPSSGEKLLWLHCDVLGFEREWVWPLRARIARELGLAERQIVISATHTHSGPATQDLLGCGEVNAAYMIELDRRLMEAARQAAAAPEDVTPWFGEDRCMIGIDRRQRHGFTANAHTDPVLPAIALRRGDGTYLAIIANYGMHNVAATGGNRLISADAAGAAAEAVRAHFPGRPVTLFTNGGAGNVNPPEVSVDFGAVERIGATLAASVILAVEQAVQCESRLASSMCSMRLPLAALSREQIERRCEQFVSEYGHQREIAEWRDTTLDQLARGAAPDHLEIDVQAFRIGPARFAAIPAEVFSRMADDLRAACGPRTYVLGYANGNIGYLPFREIYQEGKYEVELAFIVYRRSFMTAPGGFELVRDKAIDLLKALQLQATAREPPVDIIE